MELRGWTWCQSYCLSVRGNVRQDNQVTNRFFGFPFSLNALMSQMESTTSAIKRTVPVWSLFLVAILALGSVVGVFMADPQLANALSLKPTPHLKTLPCPLHR